MSYSLAVNRNLGNYLWLSALTVLNLFLGSPILLALSLTVYFLAHQVNLISSMVVVALSKVFLALVVASVVGGVSFEVLLLGVGQFIFTVDAALAYLSLGGLYVLVCCSTFFIFIFFFIFYLYASKLSSLCAYCLIMGLPLCILFLLKANVLTSLVGLVATFLLLPMTTWGSKFLLMEVSHQGGRGLFAVAGGLLLGREFGLLWYLVVASILIFAFWYMGGESGLFYWILVYFLFIGGMYNFLELCNWYLCILGWEMMGVCSFYLIGTFSGRSQAVSSSSLALCINRVGDICLFLSMLNGLWPLLLLAVFTKSSMLVFSGWLPNAMEGPTPVSALLHSSTMVVAGVSLTIFFDLVSYWVALVFTLYGLLMGLRGCRFSDYKRVIAFSTSSQLALVAILSLLCGHTYSLIYIFIHATFKSVMFMVCGLQGHSTGNLWCGMSNYGVGGAIVCTCISVITMVGVVEHATAVVKDGLLCLGVEQYYTYVFTVFALSTISYSLFLLVPRTFNVYDHSATQLGFYKLLLVCSLGTVICSYVTRTVGSGVYAMAGLLFFFLVWLGDFYLHISSLDLDNNLQRQTSVGEFVTAPGVHTGAELHLSGNYLLAMSMSATLFLITKVALVLLLVLELAPLFIVVRVSHGATPATSNAISILVFYTLGLGVFFMLDLLVQGFQYHPYGVVGGLGLGCLALASKLPIWGLHQWLPKAHVEVNASASSILGGVYLKFGVPLIVLGVVGQLGGMIVLGGVLCYLANVTMLRTTDFKVWVAYSSISHMTLLFTGVGLLTFVPVVIYMGLHTLLSACLFYTYSVDYNHLGSRCLLWLSRPSTALLIFMWLGLPIFPIYLVELLQLAYIVYLSNLGSLFFIFNFFFFVLVSVFFLNSGVMASLKHSFLVKFTRSLTSVRLYVLCYFICWSLVGLRSFQNYT